MGCFFNSSFRVLERRLLALVLLGLNILVCRHGEYENNRPKDHQAEPPMLAAPIDPTCLIRPRRRIRGFSAVLLPFAGDGTSWDPSSPPSARSIPWRFTAVCSASRNALGPSIRRCGASPNGGDWPCATRCGPDGLVLASRPGIVDRREPSPLIQLVPKPPVGRVLAAAPPKCLDFRQ